MKTTLQRYAAATAAGACHGRNQEHARMVEYRRWEKLLEDPSIMWCKNTKTKGSKCLTPARIVKRARGQARNFGTQPNEFSWTMLISEYTKHGQGREALRIYNEMLEQGVIPSTYTFVAALKACNTLTDPEAGKRIHAHLIQCGKQSDIFVATTLVDLYLKCGRMVDAREVFEKMPHRDVVSWTAMIIGYAEMEMGDSALELYARMQREGFTPNDRTFIAALKACSSLAAHEEAKEVDRELIKIRSLEKGRAIHSQVERSGFQSNIFVANTLVDMYSKCGSMVDARQVFEKMNHRTVVSWTALILGYAQMEKGDLALELYERMQREGFTPNDRTFVAALKACSSLAVHETAKEVDGERMKSRCLEEGRAIHSEVVNRGFESDTFVATALVSMYVKCGRMIDARQVFEKMIHRTVVSWNAMIIGYAQMDMGDSALQLYAHMQLEGFTPDDRTFVAALKACASLAAHEEAKEVDGNFNKTSCLEKGRAIHSQVAKTGFESNIFVTNTLVDMYAKCGSMVDARQVFDKMMHRTVVSWNAMIIGYAQMEMGDLALQLYACMQHEGFTPDDHTFVAALRACGSLAVHEEAKDVNGKLVKIRGLEKGRTIHTQAAQSGVESNIFVANTLLDMYAKCGSMVDARQVFDKMMYHDVVSWTAMIIGYAQLDMGDLALQLYAQMQHEGFTPNDRTFVAALKACSSLAAHEKPTEVDGGLIKIKCLEKGRAIHSQVAKRGLESNIFVANTLVDMYAKCGSMIDACQVFEKMTYRTVVSWTAMIIAYAQMHMGGSALQLYARMQHEGFMPNDHTFVAALKACSSLAAYEEAKEIDGGLIKMRCLENGRAIHSQVAKSGFESDAFVATALLAMYAKCGSMVDAWQVFEKMMHRTVVSWTAMIIGYAEIKKGDLALQLYARMQHEGFTPDAGTFVAALKACGSLASLETGKKIHAEICKVGLENEPSIATCLVDMYGKCGSMGDAQRLFDTFPVRDIAICNALIARYSGQGDCECVFNLFERMQRQCIQPDEITFVSVLTACSHTGLVDKGQKYFQTMCSEYGIAPCNEHYSCMVDLLGRAGQLDEAVAMVKKMPSKPVIVIWMTILGACQKWTNVEIGRHAFECAVKLDGKCANAYVLMKNICVSAYMWEESAKIQEMRMNSLV